MAITGDIGVMSKVQQAEFLTNLAKAIGLLPFPPPFEILPQKDGRKIIYAKKSCTDQLRKIYGISVDVLYAGPMQLGEQTDPSVYMVKVHAKARDGREDEEIGAVSIKGLAGEDLANAPMKAITKAKRRVTLSICGLSFLDETEVGTFGGQQASSGPASVAPRTVVPQVPGYVEVTPGPLKG